MLTNSNIIPIRRPSTRPQKLGRKLLMTDLMASITQATAFLREFGLVNPRITFADTKAGVVHIGIAYHPDLENIRQTEMVSIEINQKLRETATSTWRHVVNPRCHLFWKKSEKISLENPL